MQNNYIVTGGLGFIGSNFVNFLTRNKNNRVFVIDKETYASNRDHIEDKTNVHIISIDIAANDTDFIFDTYPINGVFNFAAESHVDNSINAPLIFTESNTLGTHKILETWKQYKAGRFIHISTDEVYGHLGVDDDPFTEETPIHPRSPYSASKAASDLIVSAYHETYGSDVVITRCCNNYGPRQHIEKFIPKIITNILRGKKVPVYGTGNNIREWIFVDAHVEAIWDVFYEGRSGEVYNIGTGHEFTNKEVVYKICELMGKNPIEVIEYVEDRKGHDFRYAIDSSKIRQNTSWINRYEFDKQLKETINWYTEKYSKE